MQSATPRQMFFAVDPDREVLSGLTSLNFDVHRLDDLTASGRAEQQGPKEEFQPRTVVISNSTVVGAEEDDGGLSHPELTSAK
jgi:hypothetical protein